MCFSIIKFGELVEWLIQRIANPSLGIPVHRFDSYTLRQNVPSSTDTLTQRTRSEVTLTGGSLLTLKAASNARTVPVGEAGGGCSEGLKT